MCFKKKTKVQIAAQDKVDIQAVYARAKQIAALADADSEVAKRVAAVAEELKYFAPSSKPEVVKVDRKLESAVDDLRPMIVGKKPEEKILDEIHEIDALVVYRKTLLETSV